MFRVTYHSLGGAESLRTTSDKPVRVHIQVSRVLVNIPIAVSHNDQPSPIRTTYVEMEAER